jgi:hypothetical protein
MTYVPRNTFLSQLKLPAGTPITSDTRQFSGFPLSFVTGTCPKLFSDETGLEFCPALCINTCPELNPVLLKAKAEQLAQAQNSLEAVETANDISEEAAGKLNEEVEVTGVLTFAIPDKATLDNIAAVHDRIETEFSSLLGFSLVVSVR